MPPNFQTQLQAQGHLPGKWVYLERKRRIIRRGSADSSFYTLGIINPGTKRRVLISVKTIEQNKPYRFFQKWCLDSLKGPMRGTHPKRRKESQCYSCEMRWIHSQPFSAVTAGWPSNDSFQRLFAASSCSGSVAQAPDPKVLGHYSIAGPQQPNTWHGPNSRNLSQHSRCQR